MRKRQVFQNPAGSVSNRAKKGAKSRGKPISEGDACETDHIVIPAQPPAPSIPATARSKPWVGLAGVVAATEGEGEQSRFRT